MTLNRTQPPAYQPIKHIEIPQVQESKLSNGIKVYHATYGTQGVFKLELFFDAGHIHNLSRKDAVVFSKMLLAGTATKNSKEINESFDRYGGFVEPSQGPKKLRFTLYGLTKHFDKFLPLVNEVLETSTFPVDELEIQKKISEQNLLVNQQKPSFIANSRFKEELFGKDNPMGWQPTVEDIQSIERGSLIEFYQNILQKAPMTVFLSGEAPKHFLASLEQSFGHREIESKSVAKLSIKETVPAQVMIEQEDAMQSTMRMGKMLFPRDHPDFFPLLVANTAFGGYFGSRLMKNIREEKGYTYGISSSIVPAIGSTYFVIGSDIVKKNTLDALREVKKELSYLHEHLIDPNELETIKNYIIGNFASSLSNSFEVMDKKRNRVIQELPEDFHNKFVENVLAVTAEQCKVVLQTHIKYKDFIEVVVGEKV